MLKLNEFDKNETHLQWSEVVCFYYFQYVGNLHELGHALGFQHEQSRADRAPALYIVKDNIQPGDEMQFKKEETFSYGVPYDYLSVMQYEGRVSLIVQK